MIQQSIYSCTEIKLFHYYVYTYAQIHCKIVVFQFGVWCVSTLTRVNSTLHCMSRSSVTQVEVRD